MRVARRGGGAARRAVAPRAVVGGDAARRLRIDARLRRRRPLARAEAAALAGAGGGGARRADLPAAHRALPFVCRRAGDALAPATTPGGGALGAAGRVVSISTLRAARRARPTARSSSAHNYAQERLHGSASARLSSTSSALRRARGCNGRRSTVAGNAAVVAVLDAALQPTAVSRGAAADVVGAFGRQAAAASARRRKDCSLSSTARRGGRRRRPRRRCEASPRRRSPSRRSNGARPVGLRRARRLARRRRRARRGLRGEAHDGPVVYDAAELLRGARPAALPRLQGAARIEQQRPPQAARRPFAAQATAPNTPAGSRPSSFKGERRRSWGDAAGAALAARRRTSVLAAASVASVPSSFAAQLGAALGELAEAHARWVLCFTPNAQQLPRTFDARAVLAQLNAAAVPTLVALGAASYPERLPILSICSKLRPMAPPEWAALPSTSFVNATAVGCGLRPIRDFQLGSSTVFFRRGRAAPLRRLLTQPEVQAKLYMNQPHLVAAATAHDESAAIVGKCAPLDRGVARAAPALWRRRPSAALTLPCATSRGRRRTGKQRQSPPTARRRRPPSRWWRRGGGGGGARGGGGGSRRRHCRPSERRHSVPAGVLERRASEQWRDADAQAAAHAEAAGRSRRRRRRPPAAFGSSSRPRRRRRPVRRRRRRRRSSGRRRRRRRRAGRGGGGGVAGEARRGGGGGGGGGGRRGGRVAAAARCAAHLAAVEALAAATERDCAATPPDPARDPPLGRAELRLASRSPSPSRASSFKSSKSTGSRSAAPPPPPPPRAASFGRRGSAAGCPRGRASPRLLRSAFRAARVAGGRPPLPNLGSILGAVEPHDPPPRRPCPSPPRRRGRRGARRRSRRGGRGTRRTTAVTPRRAARTRAAPPTTRAARRRPPAPARSPRRVDDDDDRRSHHHSERHTHHHRHHRTRSPTPAAPKVTAGHHHHHHRTRRRAAPTATAGARRGLPDGGAPLGRRWLALAARPHAGRDRCGARRRGGGALAEGPQPARRDRPPPSDPRRPRR